MCHLNAHIIYAICSKFKKFNQLECKSIASITNRDHKKEFLIDQNIRFFSSNESKSFSVSAFAFIHILIRNKKILILLICYLFVSRFRQLTDERIHSLRWLYHFRLMIFSVARRRWAKHKTIPHGKQGSLFAKHIYYAKFFQFHHR